MALHQYGKEKQLYRASLLIIFFWTEKRIDAVKHCYFFFFLFLYTASLLIIFWTEKRTDADEHCYCMSCNVKRLWAPERELKRIAGVTCTVTAHLSARLSSYCRYARLKEQFIHGHFDQSMQPKGKLLNNASFLYFFLSRASLRLHITLLEKRRKEKEKSTYHVTARDC